MDFFEGLVGFRSCCLVYHTVATLAFYRFIAVLIHPGRLSTLWDGLRTLPMGDLPYHSERHVFVWPTTAASDNFAILVKRKLLRSFEL